jgi:hypothetical protein
MADCTSIYVDNNIFEKNITFTLNKICKILNCKYYQEMEYILNRYDIDRHYIKIDVDCNYSIDEHFEREKEIDVYIGDQQLTIYRNSICIHQYTIFDFCFEWHQFMTFLHGEYDLEFEEYVKFMINEIKEFSKIFESTQMIIFNGESGNSPEIELYEGKEIEDVLYKGRWKIFKSFPIPKCQIKFEEINGNEEKALEYRGDNYIYYEKWMNNALLNPYIWENKFVRWEKGNGRIA